MSELSIAGIESSRVDYREAQTTFFLPTGESYVKPMAPPPVVIGDHFEREAIFAAICGSQAGRVRYPEFVEVSMKAGCVGYVAWIAGKHVTYFGRRGEVLVEPFL